MRATVILLAVLAAAAAAEPTEYAAAGVTLSAPATWRAAPPTGAAIALESPHGDDDAALRAAGRIAVSVAATGLRDTDAAADAVAADLARVAIGFDLRERREQVIAGRAWRRMRLRFRTGQLGWEQVMLVCVDHGRVAYCCLSSDLAHVADWQADFEAAIASLRWDPTARLEEEP